MSLIKLQDVGLTYDLDGQRLSVLQKVDFVVDRGEMVAILGPSGSGKSTLLYILGCLLQPSSGQFEFDGINIKHRTRDELAWLRSQKIGFVFQQFHLLPRASVLANVLLACQYRRESNESRESMKARATLLLERVGLQTHLNHRPNQLSGGQQQRVAIARALMNNPDLILADEPTGNLDSKSAEQVLDVLKEIHLSGRTVVIITHDPKVAQRCERVVTIHDGRLIDRHVPGETVTAPINQATAAGAGSVPDRFSIVRSWATYGQTGWENLKRNKARSLLTMLGVTIGIAAVLSTITLGAYTKEKILATYEALGVNKLIIRAYPNWHLQAKDLNGVKYEGISQENDLIPMRRLFPEIQLVSPVVQDWIKSVEFGGRSDEEAQLLGVSPEYFTITNRRLIAGHPFSHYHTENHSRVCVIGFDIAKRLFSQVVPLHQILQINGNSDKQYSCLIMGVMASQTGNSEWFKPDQQIIVPDTFLSLMTNRWYSKPKEVDVTLKPGAAADDFVIKVKQFLHLKYGRTVIASVDSDQLLVAQMRKFLNLFTMLLGSVAFISLTVGGIGITNMMLVSVAERFKEIGLRKALGARDYEIRYQFLVEAIILCAVAGLSGVLIGMLGYEAILYLASKLFPKVTFEWVFNEFGIVLSVAFILVVGIASGIVPALRAQKLEVSEALRSE